MLERMGPPAEAPPERFEDFYLREYLAVVGLAYALSGSRWAAEDLAQEAFIAAHGDWDRISRYDRPGAWVRRVVANLSVSAFRRRVVEAKAFARIAIRQAVAVPNLDAGDPEFWAAIRALPRRQAQVVALYYLEDRSIAEIADILDVTDGTVKRHLHDGRRRLSRELGSEEAS